MSISELSDRVRKELLEFAWSQWAQLGLSAHPTRADGWAADPEALILFTVEVARRDPRLFDELLDWMSRNGRLLSLQRLRNLVPRFPLDRNLVEAAVAWVGESAPSLRWRALGPGPAGDTAEGVPVFSPDAVSFVGDPDPVFARHGYLRPRGQRSGKSSEPNVREAINLAFRLRLLFGPGTRSEVMRVLLTFSEGPLDGARIADDAGFAKRNVDAALSALVASGVLTARWSGNERVFTAPRERWTTLLEIQPSAARIPSFVPWVHLLPSLVEVLLWLEREEQAGDSAYLTSSRARDLVERIGRDLDVVGLARRDGRALPGAAYLPAFAELIDALLRTIAPR